jgi:hypothetical protein
MAATIIARNPDRYGFSQETVALTGLKKSSLIPNPFPEPSQM